MGWSLTALRLFLIDLLITLPTVLAVVLLFALAAAPVLLPLIRGEAPGGINIAATIGLGVLVVLLAIVVGISLSLLMKFFWRTCALEGLRIRASIRQGYGLVRRHLRDAVFMWIIMAGLSIGWIMLIIPVVFLLVLAGAMLGGLPALLAGGMTSLIAGGAAPWIVGGLVGIPIFILVLAVPLTFLSGVWEVFKSSTWTLTYRELRGLENLEPVQ